MGKQADPFKNCIACPRHAVRPDPDPDDWFNDDDVKVVCLIKVTKAGSKVVTSMCRPYMTKEETTPPPDWCPLREKT